MKPSMLGNFYLAKKWKYLVSASQASMHLIDRSCNFLRPKINGDSQLRGFSTTTKRYASVRNKLAYNFEA